MSKDWQSQSHVKWDCKYHVVILPKYRKKEFFGRTRKAIGKILRELCRQKDVELVEGKAMPGPHPHAAERSAQIQYRDDDGVLEGQERDPHPSRGDADEGDAVRTRVLGTRLLREYRRTERGSDPAVHS